MNHIWPIPLAVLVGCLAYPASLRAQEADSGFDLRATLTAQAIASNELTEEPPAGAPVALGSRSVAYPTWKFNDHWFVTGALQLATRPYDYSDLSTAGYGAKGQVLQATLNYARVSRKASIVARVGEMSTAFGSFALRYDDADNPLVDLPIEYGYYNSPVSIDGLAGAQIDATLGKWDGRAQVANSSPANPRSIFARDQYGNWAGGLGYTIRQGIRVGVSGYRGPYLSRDDRYFRPGEINPNRLSARALGLDAGWAHGHTSVQGELQKFTMPYTVFPTYRENAGYFDVKQVLTPRWYLAARYGQTKANATGRAQSIETGGGFRLSRFELIKATYQIEHYSFGSNRNDNNFGVQFVTTFHRSFGRD